LHRTTVSRRGVGFRHPFGSPHGDTSRLACVRARRFLAADATKRTTVMLEILVRPAVPRREETYVLTPCAAALVFADAEEDG